MELTWVAGIGALPPGQSPSAHDWLARAARRRRGGGEAGGETGGEAGGEADGQDPAEEARCGSVALGLALDTGFASGRGTESETGLEALIGRALGP